jgi:UDP-N-acetylmuramate dehydrogenase
MNTADLEKRFGVARIRRNVSLSPLTTFKIGGPADFFLEVTSADELADAVVLARDSGLDFFLLGLGANILVGDRGFRGLVIRNAACDFRTDPDSVILTAESGSIVWPDIVSSTAEAGYSGFEHFAGIPSTIGGALWQNLHFLSPDRSRTVYLEEIFVSAVLLGPDGRTRTETVEYFDFGYDRSVLHHSNDIVLSARFQLTGADSALLRSVIESNMDWRRERHPPLDTEPSAGSIFKKIDGVGAGRLIDECGLKGLRMGGAEITHRHANIIINRGGARARDVRRLISHVQETVLDRTGYALEPEIAFVGEFED